jgi:hypothetical protein
VDPLLSDDAPKAIAEANLRAERNGWKVPADGH